VVPGTPYDNKLQRQSVHPGFQSFEKLVSWAYMGEIVRNVVLSLIDHCPPILFNGTSTHILNTQSAFDTYYMSLIEGASSLTEVKAVLVDHLGLKLSDVSDADAEIIRIICEQVSTRSALLGGCAVAAALIHLGYVVLGGGTSKPAVVAMGGEYVTLVL
jgi:hexokinase